MVEPLLTWSPPQSFDEFELIGPLGRGGMGRVFLARDAQLDRKVALKFIASDKPDEAAKSRFGAEARAIARLSHPNVVSVYRVGEVEERPFISYELVLGQALDELALPVHWSTLLPIAVGIVSGLAAAHREGLVHGDVKPSNVVLSLDGVPKLIDFGLARAHESESETAQDPAVRRRAAGTPAYMAPELLEGQRPGPRSDVFALGLLLRDLLSGDKSRHQLPPHKLAQLLRRGLPPTTGACAELPAAFGRVIDRCLRPRAEERYEDAAVLFAELAPLRDVLVSSSAPSAAIAPDAVLLSECLGRIWERIDAFTEDLYARLFGTYPELRTLFPGNMRDQRAKLAHALKLTVEGLRTPERLRSSLIELGRRHAAYGIAETELARLGPVLLSALREADRDNWSEELEAAWLRGWHMILESMRLGYSHSEETLWSAARSVAQTDVTVEPESFQLPRVHYATSGEAQLAWHEFGKGARDIVMVPPWLSHLEMPWRHSEYAAFLRGMGRLGRAVRYDRRGAGLSDRDVASLGGDDLSDLLAVMDAASAKSAILFAPYDAARLALELSVAHPERVGGLVLYGATLKTSRDDECRFGTAREMLDARSKSLAARWGEEALLDLVAPSRQKDASFRHFWGQYMRMALTPRRAVRELERVHSLDLRALAQACTVPTLVLHRAGDRNVPVAGGRALAEHVRKATFVELAGEDHLTFLGDTGALLREVEQFAARL